MATATTLVVNFLEVPDALRQALLLGATPRAQILKSGYANEEDPWESKVTLGRIADLILETRDTDGTQLMSTIPDLCNTGALLAIGAGALLAQDYEPDDLGGECELAFFR